MSRRNKKFTPIPVALAVKRSVAGLGLFVLSPVARGACMVEYTGKRLSKKEEDESNSLYLFDAGGGVTIDGAARSNLARYVNHSCRPNCVIDIYKHRVYVFAKRAIKAGEELTYDYDASYFNEYIKPKGCKCIKCSPQLWATTSGTRSKSPPRRRASRTKSTKKKGSRRPTARG